MRSIVAIAIAAMLGSACDRVVIDAGPDAGGPSLAAIWDPRVCDGDPRAEVQLRIEDGAGTVLLATSPCAACALEVGVGHVGWYAVSAVALDHAGGGRALASSTVAIDGPAVTWRVPW